jgi:subfamily B ATP-binding cassette protein MsbA
LSSPLDATTRRLALRVWADWVRPYRWRVAVALVLMGAVALATGAYPLVIDWTFDALAAGDAGWIMLVPPVIVAVTAASSTPRPWRRRGW